MPGISKSSRKAALVLLLLNGPLLFMPAEAQSAASHRRSITVQDVITMAKLGLPEADLNVPVTHGFTFFSPNRRWLALVVKKGNLAANTVDYSLLLYRTSQLFGSPKPQRLLTFSSPSNRDAIKGVKWLSDNDHLVFIGERGGSAPQVYVFSIRRQHLRALTHHPSPVVAYDISADGRTLFFEADPLKAKLRQRETSAKVIETHDLIHVLLDSCGSFRQTITQGEALFVKKQGERARRIELPGVVYAELLPPSLSPDGHYGAVGVFLRSVPSSWSAYGLSWINGAIRSTRSPKEASLTVAQYMLVDPSSGQVQPLLNAPVAWRNLGIAWAPDSSSVALSGVLSPVEENEKASSETLRADQPVVIEVNPKTLRSQTITEQPFAVTRWDARTGALVLSKEEVGKHTQIEFAKTGDSWQLLPSSPDRRPERSLQVSLKQDIDTPPKLYVTDTATGRSALLLDLNPQFSALRFGRAEVIHWKATDGHEVSGGLFLPPDYEAGKRYPLVIQTHGFFPGKFYMDGPWSSAFAARPLAAHGIAVLQVGYATAGDDSKYENTPREAPRQMAVYEGAIDDLDRSGIIDRARVGIIGFSRTVYTVGYTLTHSHYSFAAATLADGITGGYFDYLAFPYLSNTPLLNGGLPFGASLSSWLQNAPNFSLDRVHTPVRLEAYGPASLLGSWEWYSGLSLLGKPVELVYLPSALHLLAKPSDRMASQQGNVDWFCFWLKDVKPSSSPGGAQEFERWQKLKDVERKNSG